jgi:lycopene cyclase CruP
MGQNVDENFVNRLLAVNFEVMDGMGLRTIKPFLQDVIRFDGLVGSLARSFVVDPTYMPTIVAHVGIPRLVDWLGHVTMMGTYDILHKVVSPILRPVVNQALQDPAQKYRWRRRMESWEFGSGNDYDLPDENEAKGNDLDGEDVDVTIAAEATKSFASFS